MGQEGLQEQKDEGASLISWKEEYLKGTSQMARKSDTGKAQIANSLAWPLYMPAEPETAIRKPSCLDSQP